MAHRSHYAPVPSRADLERMASLDSGPASNAGNPEAHHGNGMPVNDARTSITRVLVLLRESELSSEVLELSTCAQFALDIVNKVNTVPVHRIRGIASDIKRALNQLKNEAKQITTPLEEWKADGVLATMLQEPRSRLSLDSANARLGILAESLRTALELPRSVFDPARVIPGAKAVSFWIRNFGPQQIITWRAFELGLETELGRALATTEKQRLQAVLDASDCGYLSVHKFAAFVQGFGEDLKTAVERVNEAVGQSWFHGFLSYNESMNMLLGARLGSFMIRFSQSSPCAFALVVVIGPPDSVEQYLIEATAGGFCLGENTYSSLGELVDANDFWLKHPVPNELSTCRFFHGFLTFPQTERLLDSKKVGTFLLRFSHSQPGSLVIALINEDNQVQQSLVHSQPDRSGYLVGKEKFDSLEALVAANKDKLQHPLACSMFAAKLQPPAGLKGLRSQTAYTPPTLTPTAHPRPALAVSTGGGMGQLLDSPVGTAVAASAVAPGIGMGAGVHLARPHHVATTTPPTMVGFGEEYGPMPALASQIGSGVSVGSRGGSADMLPEKTGNPGASDEPADEPTGAQTHPRFLRHTRSSESFLGVLPDGTSPHGVGEYTQRPAPGTGPAAPQAPTQPTLGLLHSAGHFVPPSGLGDPVAAAGPSGVPVPVQWSATAPVTPMATATAVSTPTSGIVLRRTTPGSHTPPHAASNTGYPPMPLRPHALPFSSPPASSSGLDLLASDSGRLGVYAAMPAGAGPAPRVQRSVSNTARVAPHVAVHQRATSTPIHGRQAADVAAMAAQIEALQKQLAAVKAASATQ